MSDEHLVFSQEDIENRLLWQYMRFSKFASLLHRQALFFSKIENFKTADPYEGTFPKANMDSSADFLASGNLDGEGLVAATAAYSQIREDSLRARDPYIIVNCWNADPSESTKMWREYVKNGEGIAIQSTVGRLAKSFVDITETPHDKNGNVIWPRMDKISYIDYETEKAPNDYSFFTYQPFIHKDKRFLYENELRVWAEFMPQRFGLGNNYRAYQPDSEIPKALKQLDDYKGFYFPIDLNTLIEKVVIPSNAPRWFKEMIEHVIIKFELDLRVELSSLSSPSNS